MAQTPAPWKDGPVFNQQGRAIFWTDNGKLGKWNRRVDDKSGVFSAEDAALIVRAVNSHAALVAALEAMLNAFGLETAMGVDASMVRCAAKKQAREAFSLAKQAP